MTLMQPMRFSKAKMLHETIFDNSYRQQLDLAYEKEKAKFVKPCSSFIKVDRFYQVLAIEFALNAAKDVTQRLHLEAKMIDPDSPEYMCCVFASRRIRSAWDGMSGPPPRLYTSIRDRTLRLLADLSTPLVCEYEIADTTTIPVIDDTTKQYGDILAFLRTQLRL